MQAVCSMHPCPHFCCERGEPPTKFSKRGLDKISTFRGGLGYNFHIKNKLKSEICNDKKMRWCQGWKTLIFSGFTEKSNFKGEEVHGKPI